MTVRDKLYTDLVNNNQSEIPWQDNLGMLSPKLLRRLRLGGTRLIITAETGPVLASQRRRKEQENHEKKYRAKDQRNGYAHN